MTAMLETSALPATVTNWMTTWPVLLAMAVYDLSIAFLAAPAVLTATYKV